MVSLESFARGLNTLEKSLLEDFLRGRNLCAAGQPIRNGQLSMPKVAADDMCDHVRHFLGYHMIKEFEVLDFLEESGLYVEGMENREEDVAALERRWLKPIYTAAPKLMLRLLQWLCNEGHYQEDEIRSAIAIATNSVDELPRCAQLSHFLPGPSLSAYELSHSGNLITRDSSFIAPLLQARYQDVCPSENFWGLASRGAQDKSKVECEHSARMHVSSISSSGLVTFTSCRHGSSPWPEEPEGGVEITFEKSMLPLFWEGLVVTATFQRLRDGSKTRWILSQPGYVWPSWYCKAGCMDKKQHKA